MFKSCSCRETPRGGAGRGPATPNEPVRTGARTRSEATGRVEPVGPEHASVESSARTRTYSSDRSLRRRVQNVPHRPVDHRVRAWYPMPRLHHFSLPCQKEGLEAVVDVIFRVHAAGDEAMLRIVRVVLRGVLVNRNDGMAEPEAVSISMRRTRPARPRRCVERTRPPARPNVDDV